MNKFSEKISGYRILAVLVFILLLPRSAFPAPAEKRINIMVDTFKYLGEGENSWVTAGITDTLVSDFSRIGGINVFSADDRKRAIGEIELGMTGVIRENDIVRMGTIMGASMIISGSVQTSKHNVRIISKIINVGNGRVERTVKISGTLDRLFELQDDIAFQLWESFRSLHPERKGVFTLRREDMRNLKDNYRPPGEAYKWYSRGLEVHYTDPKNALKYYLKASEADPDYFDPLFRTGWIYQNLARYRDALQSYTRAMALLEKRKLMNTGRHSNLLNNIAIVYKSMGEYSRAVENYTRSMTIRKKNRRQRTSAYAVILGNTGLVYSLMGDYGKAMEYYTLADRLYGSLGLKKSVSYATLLNNRGLLFDTRSRYGDALKDYFAAEKIYRAHSLEKTNKYAGIMTNISMIYQREKKYRKALEAIETARKIQEKLGLTGTGGYGITINNIGIIFFRKGEYRKSLEYFNRSCEIHEKAGNGNSAEYARVLNNIGVVYNRKKDYTKALEYYLKSQEIRDRLGLNRTGSYAVLMFNIGLIYHEKLGDSCKGVRYLKICVDIRKRMGHSQYVRNSRLLKTMERKCKK